MKARVQRITHEENIVKRYRGIEKAMFSLRFAGYTIADEIYSKLVQERAKLERAMFRHDCG